jgi:hypothetical protein
MKEYRVTKYDPRLRDPRGAFTGDDWISVTQIGQSFGGVVLTDQEYKRVEQAYVDVALAFLNEGGVTMLKVEGLENSRRQPLTFHDGSVLRLEQLSDVMRGILRQQFWCRLEAENGFVHFGWDYYIYIGVAHRCIAAERKAADVGLHVEEFVSPYHKELDN